ncbi:MAG TPA: Sapep family Mn(2+)-dependent dipeptidase [Candidatus Eisenbergiella merdipullorum]|uniref:Sapep family Mn(2+)-dependent dipeptidase n=1 Tax=Candidatus Eisenbergiella merdipullorum TaxID=2838553 RepID=A0A9D2L0E6_9FIRM|nr:Sapep family Mn(2+)-dependent dipeptidase [Candidatus Eisenbergiella merdipullorum]
MDQEQAKAWQKQFEAYVEAHEREMLEDAMALISIDSERMEAKPGMPFGEGTAKVFKEAERILSGHGFPVKNYDNYVLAADLNDQEPRLDVLAHLDVVPAGEGFTVTEPFRPVVKDGKLYGRGSSDDKGPAVAALYAMRAVKELGVPLSGNCRLILGADEECGSSDIKYYFEREEHAPMTFSPDADFPVINLEKGGLHLTLEAEIGDQPEGVRLVSIQAGTKVNVVPGKARAVLSGISVTELSELSAEASRETGVFFSMEEKADGIHLLAEGESAHAASPQAGNNGLTALLLLLSRIPFSSEILKDRLQKLAVLFPHGDWRGAALGVDHEDEISGCLTLSLDLFSFDGKNLSGTFDCRAPLCANDENTADVIRRRLRDAGFKTDDEKMFAAHYVPEDSELVQTLLSCYELVTGKKGKAVAIGGGTYVHHIANGVAFGCADPEVDNHMHGADEFMMVDQMKTSAVIFAMAILELCQ